MTRVALSVYAAVVAGVAIVFAGDRLPHWWLVLAAGFLATHAAVGRALGSRWLWLPMLLVIELITLAIVHNNILLTVWATPIVAGTGFAAMWTGTRSRRGAR